MINECLPPITWEHVEVDDFVKLATAFIDLGPPRSNPGGPSTTLCLQIEEDEDALEFRWRFITEDEEAGGATNTDVACHRIWSRLNPTVSKMP